MLVFRVEYNRSVDTHRLIGCHVNVCKKLPEFYEEFHSLELSSFNASSVDEANDQFYIYYKYIESALLTCRAVSDDKFLIEDLQYIYDSLMFAEIVLDKEIG